MTRKKPITKIIASVLSVVMVFGVLMFVSPTEAQAISLNATDTGFYNLAYGANGDTTFGAGSQIRVINATRENKNKNKSDAVYQFDGGTNWTPVDNNYIVWEGITDNTFYGVYPYNAEYNSFTIPTDQSGGVQDADWMTDDLTANKSAGKVEFAFQHRLAKVTVNITKWNNEFEGTEEITEPKIYTKGTDVKADYENGGATITATGENTEIDPLVNGTSFTAIVAPAEYTFTDKFMTFTVDGQYMTVFAKNGTMTGGLQPGNHYTFDLTVGKNAVELTEVKVTDWNKVDLDGGVAYDEVYLHLQGLREHIGGTATCVSGKNCDICGTEYDTTKNPDNHVSPVYSIEDMNSFGETEKHILICPDCSARVEENHSYSSDYCVGCGIHIHGRLRRLAIKPSDTVLYFDLDGLGECTATLTNNFSDVVYLTGELKNIGNNVVSTSMESFITIPQNGSVDITYTDPNGTYSYTLRTLEGCEVNAYSSVTECPVGSLVLLDGESIYYYDNKIVNNTGDTLTLSDDGLTASLTGEQSLTVGDHIYTNGRVFIDRNQIDFSAY